MSAVHMMVFYFPTFFLHFFKKAKDAGAAIRAAECQSQREVGFSEDLHTFLQDTKVEVVRTRPLHAPTW